MVTDEQLNKIERIAVRIIVILLLVIFSWAFFQSCSVAFVKGDGKGHVVNQSDAADVDDIEVDLALRKKVDSHEAKLKKHDEAIVKQEETQEKLIDTLKQILPVVKDSVKG